VPAALLTCAGPPLLTLPPPLLPRLFPPSHMRQAAQLSLVLELGDVSGPALLPGGSAGSRHRRFGPALFCLDTFDSFDQDVEVGGWGALMFGGGGRCGVGWGMARVWMGPGWRCGGPWAHVCKCQLCASMPRSCQKTAAQAAGMRAAPAARHAGHSHGAHAPVQGDRAAAPALQAGAA
jgi:hypothetical protein